MLGNRAPGSPRSSYTGFEPCVIIPNLEHVLLKIGNLKKFEENEQPGAFCLAKLGITVSSAISAKWPCVEFLIATSINCEAIDIISLDNDFEVLITSDS